MTYPDRLQANIDKVPTVSLTEQDLKDARRLLSKLAGPDERNSGSLLPEALFESVHAQSERLREKARRILALRAKRTKQFSSAMFNEPAWEMLLTLYASDGGARLSLSRLALLSGASKATALRWIEYLEQQKLVARQAHPTDKRAAFVCLTEKGRNALNDYLSDVTEVGG